MSLSRPARFPLLKLPWLCTECVIKNWDVFDIIFFALTSKRTRQIVKHLKIPLNGIEIFVRELRWIELGSKRWNIWRTNPQSLFEEHLNLKKDCLVLGNNEIPRKTEYGVLSYTDGNEAIALQMVMEFLNEVFKCSVETVEIDGDNFPGNIFFRSTVNLSISQDSTQPFYNAQSQKLKLLLENLEVTGTCTFRLNSTEKGFYCDPKLFKCRELVFFPGSAAWVTREILLQFEVPRLNFYDCPFSGEDILSFVTNWFQSDNKKSEYLYIQFRSRQVSLEKFQTEELNPLPFSGRTRVPILDPFRYVFVDFSKGLEIVRHDGLVATIHVNNIVERFLFYIWHDQSAITQN